MGSGDVGTVELVNISCDKLATKVTDIGLTVVDYVVTRGALVDHTLGLNPLSSFRIWHAVSADHMMQCGSLRCPHRAIVGQIDGPSHEGEIHVTSTDAFALKNSDTNAFLYADVGTEMNGSVLTMLSVLARLGQDPWVEAARLTTLPEAAAIDGLAQSIRQMPLDPRALADANATASRLLLLLPARVQSPGQTIRAAVRASAVPGWVPIALLCASLFMGLAFSMTSAPVPPVGAAMPIAHAITHTSTITPR